MTIPAGSITANVIMPIVDDLIHEEPEEGFLALLRLDQATFPELVDTTSGNLTLGRISDNDGKRPIIPYLSIFNYSFVY